MAFAWIMQHVAEEGPGAIGRALAACGVEPRTVRIDRGAAVPAAPAGAAALVLMGGPMSVYEEAAHPHLTAERRLVQRALGEGVPTLGICLGSQILAAALGANVHRGPAKEIGWFDVELTSDGARDPLWRDLPAMFPAFHWHGDVFDLPEGAIPLARSARTDIQAFRHGASALGLLFHLEIDAAQVRLMARSFAADLEETGSDPARLLEEGAALLPDVAALAAGVFGRWAQAIAARVRAGGL